MRILVDTNIFLDVVLERESLADESQAVLDWCETQPGDVWIAWHTLANLYYIGARMIGKRKALNQIDAILEAFDVCPTDTQSARLARTLAVADFEDAMQIAAAQVVGVECIVTRNINDFKKSPIPAMTPCDFLKGR